MCADRRSPRRIVGITGKPGAGKTTYALALVAASKVPAAYVPMDGFHLADVTLRELGRLDRKGAPTRSTRGGTPRCCDACARRPTASSTHLASSETWSSRSPAPSPYLPRPSSS